MTAALQIARLSYGSTSYAVTPNATLPLPTVFDFEHPEEAARQIFAIMSNASGGHPLRDCRVRIHAGRRTANLVANGAHVFYAPPVREKLTVEDALRIERETQVIQLGCVATDQYGNGWKRARWN